MPEQIVDSLQRPLRLTLYFSDHAARDLPQLRSYEQRVREMLQEMVARSSGRIHLQVIDPVPYSDDEASAEGNGLTPLSGGSNGERVFFGLVGSTLPNGSDAEARTARPCRSRSSIRRARPFSNTTSPSCCTSSTRRSKPRIGLISSLPMAGNPVIGEPAWTVLAQLQQLFAVQVDRSGQAHPH